MTDMKSGTEQGVGLSSERAGGPVEVKRMGEGEVCGGKERHPEIRLKERWMKERALGGAKETSMTEGY